MELTGREQLVLLTECGGLGVALALLFAVHNGVWRSVPHRRRFRFVADALFGLPAALITFYVSLAIMDGRMHPLLFVGSAIGFALTYGTVGYPLSRAVCRAAVWSRRLTARALDTAEVGLVALYGVVCTGMRRASGKMKTRNCLNKENGEKSRKKSIFFSKKT